MCEFNGLGWQLSLVLLLEVKILDLELLQFETHTLVDFLDLHDHLVIHVLVANCWHLFRLSHIYLVGRVAEPQLLLVGEVRSLEQSFLILNDTRGAVHLEILVLECGIFLIVHIL